MRVLIFHPLAEEELGEAAAYYEAHVQELGRVFVSAVEAAVAQIFAHPEAGPPVTKTVRKKILRQFPYTLLYRVLDQEIRILAVMHHKRRPYYWRGRA